MGRGGRRRSGREGGRWEEREVVESLVSNRAQVLRAQPEEGPRSPEQA